MFFLLLVDRVFGPTTTTRQVYDVAAQHIISGAMEGINGNWQIEFITSIWLARLKYKYGLAMIKLSLLCRLVYQCML